MARLRFYQTYDENGVDSECILQYWDNDSQMWQDVGLVRIPENKAHLYQGEDDCWG